MTSVMNRFGRDRGLLMFAEWTDRIAEGEVPPAPPRPQGVERNLVVTMWEWGNEIDYIHDEIATDKRNPTVNAYGPVYGVNISNDELVILDPMTHTATSLKIPLRDDPSTVPSMILQSMPPLRSSAREEKPFTACSRGTLGNRFFFEASTNSPQRCDVEIEVGILSSTLLAGELSPKATYEPTTPGTDASKRVQS